jgi:hypothetical protein
MAAEVWQFVRPKGRASRWAFRVALGGAVVFESAWVSVRCSAREDARWLAGLVEALADRGALPGCPGHPGLVTWGGDLDDDCWASVGEFHAHAEHLSGPSRGGLWYCSVSRRGVGVFHSGDHGVQPRSGRAARWLCEVVMAAEASANDVLGVK